MVSEEFDAGNTLRSYQPAAARSPTLTYASRVLLIEGFESCVFLWCIQCHLIDMTMDATLQMQIGNPKLKGRSLRLRQFSG